MRAVYALYSSPESAQRALNRLRANGIADGSITVMSPEPFENYEFGRRHSPTRMRGIAIAGAIAGFAAAVSLTWYTQNDWPINTGGMPVFTVWTNLIVMFELTMLGAVLATVTAFLVSSGVTRKLPEIYDPAVSNGRILVGVTIPADLPAAERQLRPGAERVCQL